MTRGGQDALSYAHTDEGATGCRSGLVFSHTGGSQSREGRENIPAGGTNHARGERILHASSASSGSLECSD
eukprot:760456-Pyramimonas_sp.AAC.1